MTANDSDVSDGDILTGSQVVRVYGENLTAPFVTLTFGGVEYTPLVQGEGYIEFILGDNGTATINVDGSQFMSFEVEGIVIPSFLPVDFRAYQKKVKDTTGSQETLTNPLIVNDANCINYPAVINEEYPYFMFFIYYAIELSMDFGFHNCTLNTFNFSASINRLNVSVIDSNEVAYITYQGFIVAVFNYTTD